MKFVVDLCILIDLQEGSVLDDFLTLKADVLISDAQLQEIDEEKSLNSTQLIRRGLMPASFSPTDITEAGELAKRYPQLSIFDILAFLAAKKRGATLLTGDDKLRKFAVGNNVECHGTLWLIELLVDQRVITVDKAYSGLLQIANSGSFLPKREVAKLLRKWEGGK